MRITTSLKIGLPIAAICAALAPFASASGDVTLHRDPAAAVPFVAEVGGTDGQPVLPRPTPGHRDGTAAVPFVAQVGPDQGATDDGFDWGDAGLGALAGGLLVLLGTVAVRALGGRLPRPRVAGFAGGAQRVR